MELLLIIVKSFLISLFCVGLRLTSDKGMILYFLRKPFEDLNDKIADVEEHLRDRFRGCRTDSDDDLKFMEKCKRELEWQNKWNGFLINLLKPIIGCITCMSSVWTIVLELFCFGGINKWTFLIIFVVATFNTLLFWFYLRLRNE